MTPGPYFDGLRFLRKQSPRRLANAAQVLGSYYASRLSGNPAHRGMPLSLSFEPTTSCNLRCPECPSGLRSFTRPTGMLAPELLKSTIDELQNTLMYLLLYFQGEPYLHPRFFDMVRYAADRKIYTATSTNAHFLSSEQARKTVESGLDRLIISIDGTTQETYQSYRIGGKLEKVIEGTRQVVEWKKKLRSATPHLIFQFLVVRPNEHQIAEVQALASRLGVDEVRLKTAQIYDYEEGSPLIPSLNQYSRYRQLPNGRWTVKNKLDNHCWKMWHSAVITWDGKVVPCCFDKDAQHQMGSLQEKSFREIWQHSTYQNFRKSILKGRSNIDICRNCTEGSQVWG
ncbi:SPASM domain-containing protein [Nafulsella turpanensis]|uniref:SPASM domain-containing protein n=1 Tax=Nafulsella turpanensis TaxID=1265690 RepID=UPI0003476F33